MSTDEVGPNHDMPDMTINEIVGEVKRINENVIGLYEGRIPVIEDRLNEIEERQELIETELSSLRVDYSEPVQDPEGDDSHVEA